MENINYFEDMFDSIPDYRKIVVLIFSIQNDKNLIKEIGLSKNDIILLKLEFENISKERYEEYLEYVKNIEESAIEKFLNK